MTIREEYPRHIPDIYTHIVAHPQLMVTHKPGGYLGELEPPVASLQWGAGNHIEFRENTTDDELTFYLRERKDKEGLLEGLELVVGTRYTGDRLALVYEEDRSNFVGESVLVRGYYHWQAVVPDEQNIVIRSTKADQTYNELNMSKDDGKGYFAPGQMEICLEANGIIVLTPIYPGIQFPQERFRHDRQLPGV